MKKFLAMIMALALVFSMSTVALAESPITGDSNFTSGSDTGDVKVIVNDSAIVYNVAVSWDSLDFTYNITSGAWNPGTHSYATDATVGWSKVEGQTEITEEGEVTGLQADITAANHSNAKVKVAASYVASQNQVTGVSVELTGNAAELKNAAEEALNQVANADSATFALKVTGKPTAATANTGVVVGTITVTVSPV